MCDKFLGVVDIEKFKLKMVEVGDLIQDLLCLFLNGGSIY